MYLYSKNMKILCVSSKVKGKRKEEYGQRNAYMENRICMYIKEN